MRGPREVERRKPSARPTGRRLGDLEEAATRFAAIIEATTDFVGISDVDGREIYINHAGRQMLGLGENEGITSKSVAEHQPAWATALVLNQGIPAAVRHGVWSGETAMLRPDGREIPVSQVVLAHRGTNGKVDFFATIARDISERRRAEEEKAALLQVAKDIAGSLRIEEILDRTHRRTAALLPCDRVFTYYWEPTRMVFRMVAAHGLPEHLHADALRLEFARGEPIVDHIMSGRTAVIEATGEPRWVQPELLAHFGIAALVVTPLFVRGRMMGALVAVRTEAGPAFGPSEVQLFEDIAHHVAIALGTAELYQHQQREAGVSAALARVGKELIASLDMPVLLDRLCQLTAEVIECDTCHTLMRQPEEDTYVPVSGYGYSAEHWESIRVLKVPGALLADALAQLQRDQTVNVLTAGRATRAAALAMQYGITSTLTVALRRGAEILGLLVACHRGRTEPFTAQQERIAQGIAQLASLALTNARLVEELERASRLKSDFVATMSHELRTPLNVIVGYNDLLLDGAFGALTPEQTDTLRHVEKSARELLELITATLDVSRLEGGRIVLELKDVHVPELMREIEGESRALPEKPGLDLVWQVPDDLPDLRTDPMKLKVVLKNLIGNAVKFTDKGSVTVGVLAGDGHVEFSVADTGIGIPSEACAVIFDAFRQVDSSMTRRFGGVGLGLYIARRLLDMLGGTITVESEVGRGSTFRVNVPTQ